VAEHGQPGVHVEELGGDPAPIAGVPTSTAAFLGETERGTIEPTLVTSYAEYQRWFGTAFAPNKFMPHAVRGFFENGGRRVYVCRIVGRQATPAHARFGPFTLRATGPGSWGKRVWARIENSAVKPAAGAYTAFRLRLAYWSNPLPPFRAFDPFADAVREPRPTLIEDFDALDAAPGSPDFYDERLRQGSALVRLLADAGTPRGSRPRNGSRALSRGGGDGRARIGVRDYQGGPASDTSRPGPQGLAALELASAEFSLLYAPAASSPVAKTIIAHCEASRTRLAVLDSEHGVSDITVLEPMRRLQDTGYAAFYYPWIVAADPLTGSPCAVPPGGHVLGVYARVDAARGVFKAPANEPVRGALDLERHIGAEAQDLLNPRGVNVIRKFGGRGILVWGARTLRSDPQWTYVSVRRLMMFLERSLHEGTQWAAFEPNDDNLWVRMRRTIEAFLLDQWRRGALLGMKPEEAFFVSCGENTMSEEDIAAGRLICEVGVAPLRPAEFIVFRILHRTGAIQQ
jgi:hypothetical protein